MRAERHPDSTSTRRPRDAACSDSPHEVARFFADTANRAALRLLGPRRERGLERRVHTLAGRLAQDGRVCVGSGRKLYLHIITPCFENLEEERAQTSGAPTGPFSRNTDASTYTLTNRLVETWLWLECCSSEASRFSSLPLAHCCPRLSDTRRWCCRSRALPRDACRSFGMDTGIRQRWQAAKAKAWTVAASLAVVLSVASEGTAAAKAGGCRQVVPAVDRRCQPAATGKVW